MKRTFLILITGLVATGHSARADEIAVAGVQIVMKKESRPVPFLRIKGQKVEARGEGDARALFLRLKGSYSAKGVFYLNDKKSPLKGDTFSFEVPLPQDENEIRLGVVGAKPQEPYLSRIRVVLTPGLLKQIPEDMSRVEVSYVDENQPFPQRRVLNGRDDAFQVAARVGIHYSTTSTQIYPVLGVGLKFNVRNNLYARVPIETWLITKTSGSVSPVISPLILGGMDWQSFFGEIGGGAVLFTEVNRVWVLQADVGYTWKKAFFNHPLGVFVGYRAHFAPGTRDSIFFSGVSLGLY